jgi:septal ring factor EnvC (AmiA/AmiB activator)
MLERLARALQKKTIDNDKPKLKAMDGHQTKLAEMKKITDENNRILRRIREAKSAYDNIQWAEDAKQREKYLSNMSEFSPQNTSYHITSPKRLSSANSSSPSRLRHFNPLNILSPPSSSAATEAISRPTSEQLRLRPTSTLK